MFRAVNNSLLRKDRIFPRESPIIQRHTKVTYRSTKYSHLSVRPEFADSYKFFVVAPFRRYGADVLARRLVPSELSVQTFLLERTMTNFYVRVPHSTVISMEYSENIPLKSCKNVCKAVRKVSKILQEPCNVPSKYYKWNIDVILIFHFNITVM